MYPRIIKEAIENLRINQQPDGSFLSLSAPEAEDFNNAIQFRSLFSTALILSCLASVKDYSETNHICGEITKFLLSQKSEQWSFNYWVRNSTESETMPYPDDLDDTFCALSALQLNNSELLTGQALAKIVGLLTNLEVEEGGPYRTWLVSQPSAEIWRDVDLAVNSNIAFFLHLQGIKLPKVNSFIEKQISVGKLISPYYPSVFPLIYFISRFYKGKKINDLINLVTSLQKKDLSWGNPLDTSLAITSLLNMGYKTDLYPQMIEKLIDERVDGYWRAYGFYTGVNPNRDKKYFAGSSYLTTAFCIETLSKFTYMNKSEPNRFTSLEQYLKEEIYFEIIENVNDRFAKLDRGTFLLFEQVLNNVTQNDKNRFISLLPFHFSLSLGEFARKIPKEQIVKLGMANLYGWIAYTIYDDFLDEEGDPKLLSIANISLRELTLIFTSVVRNHKEFSIFFNKTMDTLDCSNVWETTNCRYNYLVDSAKKILIYSEDEINKLAERSLGHALTPIAILFQLGYEKQSDEIYYIKDFFRNYLIAKQLNDDAHDWEKDFKKGHISFVVALLLKKVVDKETILKIQPNPINIHKMKKIFWESEVKFVCSQILSYTQLARMALKRSKVIKDKSFFEFMLQPVEKLAMRTLNERSQVLEFIKGFQTDI